MDEEMFALLQTSFEPKGTIVEPKIVPEIEPVKMDPSVSISSFKNVLYSILWLLVLILFGYGVYLYIVRKREKAYLGRELPGIQDIGPAKAPVPQRPPIVVVEEQFREPVQSIKQPDDIAIVTGRIPVWTEVVVEQETKVSENDPTIVKLIQEREALNKRFEESFSKNQKPKNI